MADYSSSGEVPWYDSSGGITAVVINNGVRNIGTYAFYGCSNLTSVAIPGSVANIGGSAFQGCSSLMSVAIPFSVTSIRWGDF
ncbi:MAG: leucine-rich repeat domain-containing protein [Tannerella sp.]|nr:leucine-rich repeat domain-containing protein [Tannerella sp.]